MSIGKHRSRRRVKRRMWFYGYVTEKDRVNHKLKVPNGWVFDMQREVWRAPYPKVEEYVEAYVPCLQPAQ